MFEPADPRAHWFVSSAHITERFVEIDAQALLSVCESFALLAIVIFQKQLLCERGILPFAVGQLWGEMFHLSVGTTAVYCTAIDISVHVVWYF